MENCRIFGHFDLKEGYSKNSFFKCKWGGGGGGCRKFESFFGNLGGFAPPPPHRKKWISATGHLLFAKTIDSRTSCALVKFSLWWRPYARTNFPCRKAGMTIALEQGSLVRKNYHFLSYTCMLLEEIKLVKEILFGAYTRNTLKIN
jgi:hypothetical protein